MTAYERRQSIIELLILRGKEKISNLAFEFGVSTKTISRDIDYLSIDYPIYVKYGNNGGVCIDSNYKAPRKLTTAELQLFYKLKDAVTGRDLEILQNFLKVFAKESQ